jgi:hypothetical protein
LDSGADMSIIKMSEHKGHVRMNEHNKKKKKIQEINQTAVDIIGTLEIKLLINKAEIVT